MVVDIMRNNPEYNLIIAGHTDSQGNDDFNMTLSDKRAAAVRQYLIDKGVSSDRLQSKGYGELLYNIIVRHQSRSRKLDENLSGISLAECRVCLTKTARNRSNDMVLQSLT